ncbi:MAG: hypothetical protein ABJ360_02145 [Roseobacter sp.]|uniref:hypothetical protein n=1 Tax=Tateyamaria sp. TaxID=1929288 RepID=UPI003289B837
MNDFNFDDALDWVENEALGTNEEGEQNALSVGGVLANSPYELIPNRYFPSILVFR